MKIFNQTADYSEKVNFVDINNVFVGYDLSRDGCGRADYFISKEELCNTISGNGIINDLNDYVFDLTYFVEIENENLDEGGMVRFKLICKDKPDLFLHLYNIHNGYYGHGFEAKIQDKLWKTGSL
jgi:hypothetical protein